MPFVPIAGRVAVFLVAGPALGAAGTVGSVVSSLAELSDVVAFPAACSVVPRGLSSFRALEGTPQEHRTPRSSAAARIFLISRLQEARSTSPESLDLLQGRVGAL
jgi:hypothetical protein